MSEKRFRAMSNEAKQLYCIENVEGEMFSIEEVVDLLNSLYEENEQLRNENKKLRKTERSWRKIHCCNKESNNCGIVIEQQATINELKEAIDYLKTVIRYTIPNEMVANVFKQIGEEYE